MYNKRTDAPIANFMDGRPCVYLGMGNTAITPPEALLQRMDADGFAVAPDYYTPDEVAAITAGIEQADGSKGS